MQGVPEQQHIEQLLKCFSSTSFSFAEDGWPPYRMCWHADEGEDTLARALKRPRLVWTPKLHQRFIEAVEQLGLKVAVPKTIMQVLRQPDNRLHERKSRSPVTAPALRRHPKVLGVLLL